MVENRWNLWNVSAGRVRLDNFMSKLKSYKVLSVSKIYGEKMILNTYDINFLIKKTKLNKSQLFKLLEEPRDFDLVLDSVSTKLNVEDLQNLENLSKLIKIKIILYHLSQDKDCDISAKSYISEILSNNYDQLYALKNIRQSKQNQEIKEFISVINSDEIDIKKLNLASSFFIKMGKRDIGYDMRDWISIIRQTKEVIKSNSSKICRKTKE